MIGNSTEQQIGTKRKAEVIESESLPADEIIGKLVFDVELSHNKLEDKKMKEYSETMEYRLYATGGSDNGFRVGVVSPEGFGGPSINKHGGDSFLTHFLDINDVAATLKFIDRQDIRPCPRRKTYSLVEGVVTFTIKRGVTVDARDLRHLKRLLNFLQGGELPNPSNKGDCWPRRAPGVTEVEMEAMQSTLSRYIKPPRPAKVQKPKPAKQQKTSVTKLSAK